MGYRLLTICLCFYDALVWLCASRLCQQPNKVYIGGLPENTRQEDLQSCFGKIGRITNIELKYVHVFALPIPLS